MSLFGLFPNLFNYPHSFNLPDFPPQNLWSVDVTKPDTVKIVDVPGGYEFAVNMAGFAKNEIEVSFDEAKSELVVSVDHNKIENSATTYGRTTKKVKLSSSVKSTDISSRYNHGEVIVTVKSPKKPSTHKKTSINLD